MNRLETALKAGFRLLSSTIHTKTFGFLAIRAFILFAVGLYTLQPAMAEVTVTGVRLGEDVGRTRLVLDLSGPVDSHVFVLGNPYRLVVDLPELKWSAARQLPGESTVGLVRNMRFGQFAPGVFRLVLDLSGPAEVTRSFTLPPGSGFPHRFVIDLAGIPVAKFKPGNARKPKVGGGNTGAQEGVASPKADPVPPPARESRNSRRTIIIDAGHGGVDPGTIGRKGTKEKAVTLGVSLKLARILRKKGGYSVHMTRERDRFIPLRQRVALARKFDGERDSEDKLFLSIHADSARNRKANGATVYTLSEFASDKESAALAAKENRADVLAGIDLNDQSDDVSKFLIDLAQRETMDYSAQFAETLIGELGRKTKLRRNTHRFAGFRVLKAPDVPAALVELGYLSNKGDEKFLNSSRGQQKLAEGIANAIDVYFRDIAR